MALNFLMHPRNPYKDKKPDFKELADKYEKFKEHTTVDSKGKVHIDFKNAECLRALSWVLLKDGFDLNVEMPLDRLIPTIPLRLNYILWLEDILSQTTQISGIDIGSGAACVYALLGAKKNGWNFVVTEVDATNAAYALKNVEHNGLSSHIQVLKIREDMTLLDIIKDITDSSLSFCMCNPPFYGSNLEAWGMLSSRSDDRHPPNSINTASPVECIVPGGEVQFVQQIIESSIQLKTQVRIYTSMLGKKSSLAVLKDILKANGITNIGTTEFCQGKTMRWGLGWSFDNTIVFPKPMCKQVRKAKPPLIYKLPSKFDGYTISSVSSLMQDILTDLKISSECVIDKVNKRQWYITCIENTWSHQRRKKRKMLQDEKLSSDINTCQDIKDTQEKRSKQEKCQQNEDKHNGEDNLVIKNKHTPDVLPSSEDSMVINNQLIDIGSNLFSTSPQQSNVNPNGLDMVISKHVGDLQSKTYLFKSHLTLETVDNSVLLELEWLEGLNREHLHQLFQYFKNKFI